MNNKPIKKFVCGQIKAAIFEEEKPFGDETRIFKTISISKSYKDREGNWKNTNN